MEELHEMLLLTKHYKGPCLDIDTLTWILRVGACSYQYMELLKYMELELTKYCNKVELCWVLEMLEKLRASELQIPKKEYGKMSASTYRCHKLQLLTVLLHEVLGRSKGAISKDNAARWQIQRKQLKEALKARAQSGI